jgi:hypothetical protein
MMMDCGALYNIYLLITVCFRWSSKDGCSDRFYKLFDLVLEFFKTIDDILRDSLDNCRSYIVYLTDLFEKCNGTNLQLQGDDLNSIKTKYIIFVLVTKLLMYKRNIGQQKCILFLNLSMEQTNDEDLTTFK